MRMLWLGSDAAPVTLVLAHSAGGPMDSPWMTRVCELLAEREVRTARFEFSYMAARREGVRRPPPKAESSTAEFRDVVAAVTERSGSPVLVGGKSYGGRVASLVADELFDLGSVSGLVCLGYPFHPPQKPDALRTGHLLGMRCPALICQGTRDPFGTLDEVESYGLSASIDVKWFEGNHDVRSITRLDTVADAVTTFARSL